MTNYLDGFDYVSYLKRKLLVGQIDPWRVDDEDKPIFALLVSVEDAISECKNWSNQEIGRKTFLSHLKVNNVFVFKSSEEFKETRDKLREQEKEIKKQVKKGKRNISDETREKLRNRMLSLHESKKASITENLQ